MMDKKEHAIVRPTPRSAEEEEGESPRGDRRDGVVLTKYQGRTLRGHPCCWRGILPTFPNETETTLWRESRRCLWLALGTVVILAVGGPLLALCRNRARDQQLGEEGAIVWFKYEAKKRRRS